MEKLQGVTVQAVGDGSSAAAVFFYKRLNRVEVITTFRVLTSRVANKGVK